MLKRAENTLDLVKGILQECRDKQVSNLPLLESIVAQYLAVICCSDVEKEVLEIVSDRLSKVDDIRVAHLILKTKEGILKRIPKSELSETVKFFGEECSEKFQSDCAEADVSFYSNLIAARHKTAHPGSSNISIDGVDRGIEAGKRILEHFNSAIFT